MDKLLKMLASLIEKVEEGRPRLETGEWYLLNNLRRFKEISEGSPSQQEFENANHVLSRFNVDSMDWDDPLFKEVTAITELARQVKV